MLLQANMKSILVLLTSLSIATAWEPWLPVPKNESWWMDRFNSNVNNTQVNARNISVIFYGDSITEGWGITAPQLWNQHYAPLGTANYGIGGDLVQHLLWRAMSGELNNINLRPKLVVLKIGTNNINLDFSVEADIARGIRTVVGEIKRFLPGTKILVLGVLPRNDGTWTDYVERINNFAMDVDDGVNVRFLNMRDAFYNTATRQLYTEFYRGGGDLLHLSYAGYVKWQETMDPLFQQMMNS